MKLDESWSVNILCRMFTPGQCHILVVKLHAFIFGLAFCKCHWNLSWSLQRSFGDFLMANKNLYRTNVNSFGINGSMIVSSTILGIWNVKRYFCGFNSWPPMSGWAYYNPKTAKPIFDCLFSSCDFVEKGIPASVLNLKYINFPINWARRV